MSALDDVDDDTLLARLKKLPGLDKLLSPEPPTEPAPKTGDPEPKTPAPSGRQGSESDSLSHMVRAAFEGLAKGAKGGPEPKTPTTAPTPASEPAKRRSWMWGDD